MKIENFIVFLFLGFLFIILSCKKEPTIIKETIIQSDTLIVNKTDTLLVVRTDTLIEPSVPVTLFIVRHAEKGTGQNPSINADGQIRADALAHFLERVHLDAIYSSNYNRTIETATPTATNKNIPIKKYNANNIPEFAEELIANYSSKTVLIIGHSNTNPALINSLTNTQQYPDIDEKKYDDLFLLKVHTLGDTEVLHLKYGEPTL